MWRDTVLSRNSMVLGSKQKAALLDKSSLKQFSLWKLLGCMPANLANNTFLPPPLTIPVTLSISGRSCWISLAFHYWSIPTAGKCRLGSWCSVYHINLLQLIYRVFCQTSSAC